MKAPAIRFVQGSPRVVGLGASCLEFKGPVQIRASIPKSLPAWRSIRVYTGRLRWASPEHKAFKAKIARIAKRLKCSWIVRSYTCGTAGYLYIYRGDAPSAEDRRRFKRAFRICVALPGAEVSVR